MLKQSLLGIQLRKQRDKQSEVGQHLLLLTSVVAEDGPLAVGGELEPGWY